jgi:putative photosynthetic complex assembly protein 2
VPLTPGAAGAARFSEAVGAVLHHELALLVCGAAVVAVSYGGANPTGLWTFAVLWIMRLSAKLNLFLGVPNRGEAFLPERLRYLASYFADRPINALLPVSITGATAAALLLALQVLDPATLPGAATGLTLVTALLALAIVEHWFMILPVPVVALWGWGLSSRTQGAADAPRLPEPQPRRGLRLVTRPMPRLAVVPAGAIHEQAVPNHRRGT